MCFHTSSRAAEFIAENLRSGWSPDMTIHHIEAEDNQSTGAPSLKLLYIIVSCASVFAIIFVLMAVMSRKRTRGVTWFPEGFFFQGKDTAKHSHRRKPDGEEMKNLPKGYNIPQHESIYSKKDANDNRSTPITDVWNTDDCEQPHKRIKFDDIGESNTDTNQELDQTDTRQWTQRHFDAANLPSSILALTPPRGDDQQVSNEVDVRGPDGFTPLMLASFRGQGLDTDGDDEGSGEGENDDKSTGIITNLLMQGAAINARTDRTGESSLHLAARYARADAAKILLEAGADPNAQDCTGRTPLHTSVSADAQGVFQILLRNRSTNLNARMNCGTTPMILAVRLAIERMVEDLINTDADINAADDSGKTALHWAASVNNVAAAKVLLHHGANRDAQDNKDETPLFLAAREGGYETAKVLLDYHANRDITDHMDRLPKDMASEKLHHDIVRLLEEYNLNTQPPMPVHSSSIATSPPSMSFIQPSTSKQKQRPRKTSKTNQQNKDTLLNGQPTKANNGLGPQKAKPRKKKTPEVTMMNMAGNDMSCGKSPQGVVDVIPTFDPNACSRQLVMNSSVDPEMDPVYRERALMRAHYSKATPNFEVSPNWFNAPQQPQQLPNIQQQQQQQAPAQQQVPNASTIGAHLRVVPQAGVVPQQPPSSLANNVPSPVKPKNLPTSPTHMQAMQQHAQQNLSAHQEGFTFLGSNNSNTTPEHMGLIYMQDGHQPKISSQIQPGIEQYPTPPSQHSHVSMEPSPQHLQPPDHYLTPSPDSPGQWSSSSPHSPVSAHSDWSDASPIQTTSHHTQHRHSERQKDAVYI